MNKVTKIINESNVYKMYHIPGCVVYMRRPKNAIYFNPSNGVSHELAKAKICYNLQKQGKKFITEAVENETNLRRDVVCLDGEIYEVENSKSKRGHRHPKNINVFWYDLSRFRTTGELQQKE